LYKTSACIVSIRVRGKLFMIKAISDVELSSFE